MTSLNATWPTISYWSNVGQISFSFSSGLLDICDYLARQCSLSPGWVILHRLVSLGIDLLIDFVTRLIDLATEEGTVPFGWGLGRFYGHRHFLIGRSSILIWLFNFSVKFYSFCLFYCKLSIIKFEFDLNYDLKKCKKTEAIFMLRANESLQLWTSSIIIWLFNYSFQF